MNEFHEMIDQAKKDSDAGKVITPEDLKKKVRTWKIRMEWSELSERQLKDLF